MDGVAKYSISRFFVYQRQRVAMVSVPCTNWSSLHSKQRRPVEFDVKHLFVEVLEFADCELVGEKFEADGFEVDFATKRLESIFEDGLVVESELRHFVNVEPACISGIIAGGNFAVFD